MHNDEIVLDLPYTQTKIKRNALEIQLFEEQFGVSITEVDLKKFSQALKFLYCIVMARSIEKNKNINLSFEQFLDIIDNQGISIATMKYEELENYLLLLTTNHLN